MICLGPWQAPQFRLLKDAKLKVIATQAYVNLCNTLLTRNKEFLEALKSKGKILNKDDRNEVEDKIESAIKDLKARINKPNSAPIHKEESALPTYRWIIDNKCTTDDSTGLKGDLNLLLVNQLRLGNTLNRNDLFPNHFLISCWDDDLKFPAWESEDT